jgi:nitroreductase
MDVIDEIRNRHSVRSYQSREVEEEKLQCVLEAGRLAPSAGNRQEWRYVVVREKETRKMLMAAAGGQSFVAQAPIVIAACAETDNRVMMCGQPAYPIDVAISVDHMTLQAAKLGLGTCWIGAFDEAAVKRILGIPSAIRVVQLLTLGYPASGSPPEKKRKELPEIVMYEKWSGKNKE